MADDGQTRVLIVDDDLDVLRAFKRLLEEHATVQVALGAQAAFEHMQKVKQEEDILYDVVVVDFNMVGHNGAWLLRRVLEHYPDCRRILLSGSSYLDLTSYLDPGLVDRFLEKPLDYDELIEAVTDQPA